MSEELDIRSLTVAAAAKLLKVQPKVVRAHIRRGLPLPYVAVDEAKKAIFAGSNIGAFHFLVYSTDGPNHLALVTHGVPTPKQEAILSDWQKIFGGDFIGMFVKSFAGGKGPWVFLRLGTNGPWAPYPPGIEPESNPQGDKR
jgi:hypothetical protein